MFRKININLITNYGVNRRRGYFRLQPPCAIHRWSQDTDKGYSRGGIPSKVGCLFLINTYQDKFNSIHPSPPIETKGQNQVDKPRQVFIFWGPFYVSKPLDIVYRCKVLAEKSPTIPYLEF
jgi:hypothetical protein